ncbi:type II toxin-antitoxin system RelE/ParE family toxin [Streptomyces sp. NPDC052396]|uniref:type II toxin-antitoxin system RelE/ParE family toxin n=1 Tax=Streptomyces sp. NPDC052396 TaxID=3365689 RepID=UPI0037D1D504
MERLYTIEIEPEVRSWLESLPVKHYLKVEEYACLLAEQAATLGEPYARYLGDGLRELRPTLDGASVRITYWLTPGRTAVLLTVFHKTKQHEDGEIQRAKLARKTCMTEHGPAHEEFSRTFKEGNSSR